MTSDDYTTLASYWHIEQALHHLGKAKSKLDGDNEQLAYQYLKGVDQLAYDVYCELEDENVIQ